MVPKVLPTYQQNPWTRSIIHFIHITLLLHFKVTLVLVYYCVLMVRMSVSLKQQMSKTAQIKSC